MTEWQQATRPRPQMLDPVAGPAYQIIAATTAGWARRGINLPAISLSEFQQRGSPLCWDHDWQQVIGRVATLRHTPEGLVGEIQFSTHPRAQQIKADIDGERVRGVSIAIDGLGQLIEVSLCSHPEDRDAAVRGRIVLRTVG